MKNYIKIALALLATTPLFMSCADDNDSNPTLDMPSSFILNTPAYAGSQIDLATTTAIPFSWEYPNVGFPVALKYSLQISATGSFNSVYNPALSADEQTVESAITDSIYSGTKGVVKGAEIAKALERILKYPKGGVPTSQDAYVRLRGVIGTDTIYSNSIKLNVTPYYVELKDAEPRAWWLVGGIVADGKWGNNNIGVSTLPMYTIAGNDYDKVTGDGDFQYIAYFPAGAFKILTELHKWEYGIVSKAKNMDLRYRNADDPQDDITLPSAGYYKITLNTKSHDCKIEEYKMEKEPTMFATMNITGAVTAKMNAINTYNGAKNHDWYASITVAQRGVVKFTSGSTSWGTGKFPYGVSTATGAGITVKPGEYDVFFNDLLGAYLFFEKKQK